MEKYVTENRYQVYRTSNSHIRHCFFFTWPIVSFTLFFQIFYRGVFGKCLCSGMSLRKGKSVESSHARNFLRNFCCPMLFTEYWIYPREIFNNKARSFPFEINSRVCLVSVARFITHNPFFTPVSGSWFNSLLILKQQR